MAIPSQFLLSNLLQLNVRCNQGFDHGSGVIAWMYPPVHRLLGWASKPSNLSLSRSVWRLNQIKSITYSDVFVKGIGAESDQATINRFPTLIDAILINNNGEKLAIIADFVFDTKTGNILYYLISRSNPKIPGTSRWRLDLDKILDQEPGCVSCNINFLDELPLVKSSIRQDFLSKSQKLRDNLLEITNIANDRLEGWLDENPLNDVDRNLNYRSSSLNTNDLEDEEDFYFSNENNPSNIYNDNKEDPWI